MPYTLRDENGAPNISPEAINELIQTPGIDTGKISDGYHTFDELYAHRVALFIALANNVKHNFWKAKLHEDGTMFDGWFIAGMGTEPGMTLTYHIPISDWDILKVDEIHNSPAWDGHTPDDCLRLIRELLINPSENGK